MKLALRSKFYLLILPAVVVLILILALLLVPFGHVQKNVEQVNEGLDEVIAAESFARNYSRLLRQCSSFIATGLADHERQYESAKQEAGAGISGWIKAEKAHKGDPPAEHAEELEMLNSTSDNFRKVSDACDWSIALARDGKRDAAMANFEQALDGGPGTTVETNIDEQLPEEEAQLTRYLDNLWGAVNSDPLMRFSGINSNVESMQEHSANTIFAQQFARNYNNLIESAFSAAVTGETGGQDASESADRATEALGSWESHAEQRQGKGSVRLVDGMQKQFKDVSGAITRSEGMIGSGDIAGAVALLETKAGASAQDSLKVAIEGEVASQTAALRQDAGSITSTTQWTTAGVATAGGLLVLMALVGAFMVARTVVKPVVDLRDAAKEFGEGGDFHVDVKSRDEIGDLAATMNTMAAERVEVEEALRESRDQLEARVEERTRQLSDINEELLQQIEERGKTESLLRDEQEFTKNVIDSLSDIFYVLSVEQGGRFVRWNKAFREVSGYTDEELAGMTVLDFFGDTGQQEQLEFLQELMANGSAQIEAEPVTRDGRVVPYFFSSTLVRDQDGEPVYVTGVGRDMTAIKKAQEALRESEERYRQIFENATEGIFQSFMEGTLRDINPAFARMYGYDSPEQMKKEVTDIAGQVYYDPADRQEIKRLLVQDKVIRGMDVRFRRRDGSPLWVNLDAHLVRDPEGNILYLEGTTTDVSERMNAEKRLRASEEKYRFLADHMEDLAFIMGIDTKSIYVSPSVERLLGYTEAEWNTMTIEQKVTPESFEYLISLLAEELGHDAERDPHRNRILETDFLHKDGRRISFECMVSFIRDEESRPAGVYGLARNITERKIAEQRLRLTQFEIESAMDLIVRVAADGHIAYANRAAASLLGYDEDELAGTSVSRVMLNFPAEHWEEIWEVLEQAKMLRFEATAVRRNGESLPIDASFNFFEFEGEDYMVIFGRDITERRIAEQNQEELNRELMSANKELNDFAYVVSHDLKAPLRGIGSLANWLAADYSDVLDDEGRRQLDLLLDRAKRMESLIESILQYSRVGRLREETETVDLSELVPSVVELLAVPPNIEVAIEPLPIVRGEKTRLGQVFQNLVGNAVKFIDRETGGKVTVSAQDMGDSWTFAVADNGPGIDEKYHGQIFGIFQTLQAGYDKDSTGVGLTLVRKIVEMHGGQVWLESKLGEGATFYFTLPRD